MIDYPGETKYDKEFITFVLTCRTIWVGSQKTLNLVQLYILAITNTKIGK